MKIGYALVCLNRKDELILACKNVSPYVDRTFISDGGSTDGTIEWLESPEAKSLNIGYTIKKQVRLQYGNHTPEARQPYLNMALAAGMDWLYVSDTDEYLEEAAAKNLHQLVQEAQAQGCDGIGFQAWDYWTYETGEIYDNVSNYWNSTMFKVYPGMKYGGHTHSGIVRPGAVNRFWKAPFKYKHVKHERQMWKSSTFLYWTTSKNADNVTTDPEWLAFHEMMKKYGFLDWHELNKVMDKGELPDEICQWFIANRNDDNPERAAWFIHYFILLHPELNTQRISSERHNRYTWDYVEQCRAKRNG